MRILISITSKPGLLRTSITMAADTEAESDTIPVLPHDAECRPIVTVKEEPADQQDKQSHQNSNTMADSPAQSSKAKPKPWDAIDLEQVKEWASTYGVPIGLQLLSLLFFFAILLPYAAYASKKKKDKHQTCTTIAQRLYETNLARCDANAAGSFSLPGGTVGFNWLEITGIAAASAIWHFLTWYLQREVAAGRIHFSKNRGQK
ncbi:hypothetical protein HRR77_006916 [Exophiala dermatitidis]|nr:hypothetical protein HRR77_006916 [Exophiala dermatitidis]KAJ4561740.1 hypothetical protein HRR79_007076 [Exophiala dermatitidis]KAJ4613662.1 hypothetical protein HRR85_003958 [Exophiala dermatitidis]KAJ4692260.1 hypothetical protein HRR87_006857 [Exophiala dermatitidis]